MTEQEKREKVIEGLEHCSLDDEGYPSCKGCPYGPCNVKCSGDLHADALAQLKVQNKDAEIICKCREGKVLKHVGDGVVVLNYDWWRKMNEKCDHIKIVPSVEDLLKAQEPVEPVFERIFMSDIEIYDCGKCGTSLGAKGIAKYCMNCGRAVKWE